MASKSDQEARRGLWLGGLLYVPVSALFFLIGTSLYVYYQAHDGEIAELKQLVARQRVMQSSETGSPWREVISNDDHDRQRLERAAATLTTADIGDRAFPHFIAKHLPPGATGLLIAAIFAAAMSTVSTSLNSSATLLLGDYYRRFLRPHASETESMRVLLVATVGWGVLGTAMALALVQRTESALDMWWELASLFSGGMVGLFLLGMVSRRAGNPAALAAVGLGTILLAWMAFSPTYWGRVGGQVHVAADSRSELVFQQVAGTLLVPGEMIHVHYEWLDAAADSRTSIVETRRVEKTEGKCARLTTPLERDPVGAVRLYRDNRWYRWRSPFHNYLAIVFGSTAILVAGIAVQWCWDRSQRSHASRAAV